MAIPDTPEEKAVEQPLHDEQNALEEIHALRSAKRQPDRNRVADFDTNTKDRALSDIPMNTHVDVLHPDGATSMPIMNAQEFKDALLAAYSDGHGDFGLYDPPQEADAMTHDEAIDENVHDGLAVSNEPYEDMNIIGFIDLDNNGASGWERTEYRENDLSQDDPFDMER